MAATPTQCSEVVLLLSSLILPLAHLGDVRPYMHADDTDLAILAATAKRKRIQQATGAPSKEVGTSSMIVGVCDVAALEKLSSFSAAILLTPQGTGAVADPDAVFRGMRKKNAAQCVQLDQRGYSAMGVVGELLSYYYYNYYIYIYISNTTLYNFYYCSVILLLFLLFYYFVSYYLLIYIVYIIIFINLKIFYILLLLLI